MDEESQISVLDTILEETIPENENDSNLSNSIKRKLQQKK